MVIDWRFVDFVDDAVAAHANPPTFTAGQLAGVGWPGVVAEVTDCVAGLLVGLRGELLFVTPCSSTLMPCLQTKKPRAHPSAGLCVSMAGGDRDDPLIPCLFGVLT